MSLLTKIYKDDELLFDNISVYISESIDPLTTFKMWEGSFETSTPQYIEQDGFYNLELQDGRKGEFFVNDIVIKSEGLFVVHFKGYDPLE
jgi:hypothetical protein